MSQSVSLLELKISDTALEIILGGDGIGKKENDNS